MALVMALRFAWRCAKALKQGVAQIQHAVKAGLSPAAAHSESFAHAAAAEGGAPVHSFVLLLVHFVRCCSLFCVFVCGFVV